ncbi:hypothetical protein MCJ35_31425, partial [Enterocloster sp. OA13]|uniref:hypothetical protein n=1 Tax=Enterocloster sp. OA13 TaxID=2914161 RepID=UPI001F0683A7|nr:hypothetical protein [Enterocloster sp. OA13]
MERKQEDKPPEEPPEELLKEFEWAKDHIRMMRCRNRRQMSLRRCGNGFRMDMESKEKAGTGLTGPANFILFHTYICRPIRHSKVTN